MITCVYHVCVLIQCGVYVTASVSDLPVYGGHDIRVTTRGDTSQPTPRDLISVEIRKLTYTIHQLSTTTTSTTMGQQTTTHTTHKEAATSNTTADIEPPTVTTSTTTTTGNTTTTEITSSAPTTTTTTTTVSSIVGGVAGSHGCVQSMWELVTYYSRLVVSGRERECSEEVTHTDGRTRYITCTHGRVRVRPTYGYSGWGGDSLARVTVLLNPLIAPLNVTYTTVDVYYSGPRCVHGHVALACGHVTHRMCGRIARQTYVIDDVTGCSMSVTGPWAEAHTGVEMTYQVVRQQRAAPDRHAVYTPELVPGLWDGVEAVHDGRSVIHVLTAPGYWVQLAVVAGLHGGEVRDGPGPISPILLPSVSSNGTLVYNSTLYHLTATLLLTNASSVRTVNFRFMKMTSAMTCGSLTSQGQTWRISASVTRPTTNTWCHWEVKGHTPSLNVTIATFEYEGDTSSMCGNGGLIITGRDYPSTPSRGLASSHHRTLYKDCSGLASPLTLYTPEEVVYIDLYLYTGYGGGRADVTVTPSPCTTLVVNPCNLVLRQRNGYSTAHVTSNFISLIEGDKTVSLPAISPRLYLNDTEVATDYYLHPPSSASLPSTCFRIQQAWEYSVLSEGDAKQLYCTVAIHNSVIGGFQVHAMFTKSAARGSLPDKPGYCRTSASTTMTAASRVDPDDTYFYNFMSYDIPYKEADPLTRPDVTIDNLQLMELQRAVCLWSDIRFEMTFTPYNHTPCVLVPPKMMRYLPKVQFDALIVSDVNYVIPMIQTRYSFLMNLRPVALSLYDVRDQIEERHPGFKVPTLADYMTGEHNIDVTISAVYIHPDDCDVSCSNHSFELQFKTDLTSWTWNKLYLPQYLTIPVPPKLACNLSVDWCMSLATNPKFYPNRESFYFSLNVHRQTDDTCPVVESCDVALRIHTSASSFNQRQNTVISTRRQMSWLEARESCQAIGQDLPMLKSKQGLDRLIRGLGKDSDRLHQHQFIPLGLRRTEVID